MFPKVVSLQWNMGTHTNLNIIADLRKFTASAEYD